MAKKKHIPLFDDQLEMLELLTDQEVGQAVLAAMRFMRSGTETDLTGGAGVVYQVLRAQFIRNQNDAAVGKKGGRPRKSPAETPVSEAETTERNETEPDGTGQDGTEPDETESDRTGGGDGSAGWCFFPMLRYHITVINDPLFFVLISRTVSWLCVRVGQIRQNVSLPFSAPLIPSTIHAHLCLFAASGLA